jgi:hypothetical protein
MTVAAVQVQSTQGGKFLDPMENVRGCLRALLVLFLIGIVIAAWLVLR